MSENGPLLVGNHAYSVMEVRELHGAAVGRQTKLTGFVNANANDGRKKGEDSDGRERGEDDDGENEVVFTGEMGGGGASTADGGRGGGGGGGGDGGRGGGGVAAAAPLRLLRIRNPWGRKEWSGEWGAGSEVWTSKLGSALGHTRADDGTFWMSWHDFLCRFTVVDVCKAGDDDVSLFTVASLPLEA